MVRAAVRVAAEHPAQPLYQFELANAHFHLANDYLAAGQRADALAAFRACVDVVRRVAADYPALRQYRHYLGKRLLDLGELQARAGRPGDGEAAYREAVAVGEGVVGESQFKGYAAMLAAALRRLAGVHQARNELTQAWGLLAKARPRHAAAVQRYPRLGVFRREYRQTLRQACEVAAARKDHAGLAGAASDLAALRATTPGDTVHAARRLAEAAALAGGRTPGDEASRQATERYTAAVGLLHRAVEKEGFANAGALRWSPDFRPIRGRSDFQAVLATLAGKDVREVAPLPRPAGGQNPVRTRGS